MASFSDSKAHLRSSSITRVSAAQSYTLVLQQDASTGEAVGSSSAAADAAATAAVYMKVSIRLLPLFMTMLVLNWLDRSCLAFASIQMTQELHFTPEVCMYKNEFACTRVLPGLWHAAVTQPTSACQCAVYQQTGGTPSTACLIIHTFSLQVAIETGFPWHGCQCNPHPLDSKHNH